MVRQGHISYKQCWDMAGFFLERSGQHCFCDSYLLSVFFFAEYLYILRNFGSDIWIFVLEFCEIFGRIQYRVPI
jgi:hypothetical protein